MNISQKSVVDGLVSIMSRLWIEASHCIFHRNGKGYYHVKELELIECVKFLKPLSPATV